MSGRLLGGAAQDLPVHVGAEVFAADGAAGGALDRRAVLRRYAPARLLPLIDGCSRHSERLRERGL